MSKKIAAGAQAIVLDVKTGVGAFMQTQEDARRLAELMVSIGRRSERRVTALISDMNQPLGHAVGNALELREAIDTLQGKGPKDFLEHCLVVASHMLVIGRNARDLLMARGMLEEALRSGKAWERFRALVAAQGGDVSYVDDPEKLPKARRIKAVPSPVSGYLQMIHAREVGETAVDLGAGRARKGDPIDHAVGIVIHHKVGDRVEKGEPLFTIHAQDDEKLNAARERLLAAYRWSEEPCPPLPLFYEPVGMSELIF
jgi:pyrimidine-nucleoside phosphorylase